MKKRKVVYLMVKDALSVPGAFGGELSLSPEKFNGIEIFTGEEPGFVTVYFKNKFIGIPYPNVRNVSWEKSDE